MKPLPKQYDHKEAEKRWQGQWEAAKVYAWDESLPRDQTFVIDTPPPTVSGILHMGHIFSYTQADFVARYQRMSGKTVFYPMGFDDNGLPTERLVEKVKKVRATDMSREDFIKLCEGVAEEARVEFRRLFTSVALSVDWAQEYNTISEHCRRTSQMSFLDLMNKGHVYRKLQPMLWDPVDQTAIAQAEIEDKELASFWNDITFDLLDETPPYTSSLASGNDPLANDLFLSGAHALDSSNIPLWEKNKLVIGTTRPELLGSCVALFFNPKDPRYNGTGLKQHGINLWGKTAIVPLFGIKVPILADETVEIDKGTGLMMCCTFGDEKDIDKWRKHSLPTRVVLNKYGKIDFTSISEPLKTLNVDRCILFSDSAHDSVSDAAITPDNTVNFDIALKFFQELKGLKVSNPDPKHPGARQKILELLKEAGLLLDSKPITHTVKCAERSGAPLEILPTFQWFVKVLDKKEQLHAKAAECQWHPPYMQVRMDQWIDGLSWDWCISRQRYFGVPFPVWYSKRAGEEGKILTADADQLPCNPLVDLPKGYTRDEVEPEPDVMDTWATSSVSPQISSHGISKELCDDAKRHAQLFPADLRPQAHEIIRTWAFYTVVKAMLHEDTIPWSNLMISGWCLASDKTKMSKSKGNVITPVDLIEEKGADVVRYWASTSRLGADTAFSEDVLKIGKKLVTKLWNASNFASLNLDKIDGRPGKAVDDNAITETLDKWILSRLHTTVKKATEEFEKYEYSNARAAIEDFFWNDFCDNYLELVKARSYGENSTPAAQQSALHAIYHCLEALLRLFAPIIPHVTDEIYSYLFDDLHHTIGSITARGTWPKAEDYPVDKSAEQQGVAAVSLLNAIRKAKSEKNVSIKYPLTLVEIAGSAAPTIEADLKSAGNALDIQWKQSLATETLATDDGAFKLHITFADQGEAA